MASVTIPKSVVIIEKFAFMACVNLQTINYNGTTEQWEKIELGNACFNNIGATVIHCAHKVKFLELKF